MKKYSDYIRYPIKMKVTTSVNDVDEEGKEIEDKYHDVVEDKTLNSMLPLWKRNKKHKKTAYSTYFEYCKGQAVFRI